LKVSILKVSPTCCESGATSGLTGRTKNCIKDYYFSHPMSFSRALYFFQKCPCDFWMLKFELSFSFVIGWKKWVFHQFGFYNPKTSKNMEHYLMFSDYRVRTPPKHPISRKKQFGLYNLNSSSTNSELVCNMDNQFKDHINLLNYHPHVLGHC